MGRRKKHRSRKVFLMVLVVILGFLAFGWYYTKNTMPEKTIPATTVQTEMKEQNTLPPEGMETGELPEEF